MAENLERGERINETPNGEVTVIYHRKQLWLNA